MKFWGGLWRLWLAVLVLSPALFGCTTLSLSSATPKSAFDDWKPADLRYLQAPDSDPQHSLIGLYQRETYFDLEIRLDFLDLAYPTDFDVYIALDTRPGGRSELEPLGIQTGLMYDLMLKIPAGATPVVLDRNLEPFTDLAARVVEHPGLDAMVIQLNRARIPGNPRALAVQVFVTAAGKSIILSQTPAVFEGQSRPKTAPLLLVFWNTLPAVTPAQVLRRWEGAHTGPLGGRHGLNVLLEAAGRYHIPLVLADLKQAASLNGLNAVGGTQKIVQKSLNREVILPDTAASSPQSTRKVLEINQAASTLAGLTTSAVAFGSFISPFPAAYSTFFASLADPHHLVTWQGKRLVPLPEEMDASSKLPTVPQIAQQGLSLDTRQKLLAAALSDDPGRLVVLGGSLPESSWGDLSTAPIAFDYINRHPWIHPLMESELAQISAPVASQSPLPPGCRDLLCTPAVPDLFPINSAGQPGQMRFEQLQDHLFQRLSELPDGYFSRQGWQSFFALTAPTSNLRLAGLQANALGQIAYLVEAARWDAKPYTKSDCSADLDFDGIKECILASTSWFTVIKPDGARLVFAANLTSQGPAQWIGAFSQLAAGQGDPSEWHPEAGPAGDPADIPGAFSPDNRLLEMYQIEIRPGEIQLRNTSDGTTKIFRLGTGGLAVSLSSAQVETSRIPLIIASQEGSSKATQASWQPAPRLEGTNWLWQPAGAPGLRIAVRGAEELSGYSFLDSAANLTQQEDPNRAYPRGHYLPFPFALLQVKGSHVTFEFSTP